ncbi:hypothetical protein COOONC_18421, partial [Cooperia oncophora]
TTSRESAATVNELNSEAHESGPVPGSHDRDDQPSTLNENNAPDQNSAYQEEQTGPSQDTEDGGREAEPAEHVPSKLTTSPADRQDGNVPPIETDTPTSGGDLQRVKHSKTSLASRSLKSEGPRPSPVRKRPFEKAKPNIKVKKSRATSHSVEEAKSTPASSATDATVPEAPAADEAQDTVTREPNNDTTSSSEPRAPAPTPIKPQQAEEDLFKRTRPVNRNKLKRPLRSRR